MAQFTTSDGLKLYFEDNGSGNALLCLPGLTRNTRDFDFLAPHMQDVRMITMDYRGRGQSEYDPVFANYNIIREAQDVLELLDHLNIAHATLLGTSRGGMIAMALAAGHIDRLSGVILNDIGPVISTDGIARIMEYVGKPPASVSYEQAAMAMKAVLGSEFPDLPDSVWQTLAKAQFSQTETGLALRYDPRLRDALIEQAAAGPTPDLWPLFDALKPLPVGVLRGANSDILRPDTVLDMQARHSGLIAAEVPNRGHVPLLDEPESLHVIRTILEAAT